MHIKRGKLDEIIDPSLNGEMTPHNLKYFAVLAKKCLRQHPNGRPTMAEVAESLEIALASHKHKERSGKKTVKTFQGIKHVLIGKNSWWRERTGNGSNHGGRQSNHSEPISDNVAQSVYTCFSLAEIRAATNDFDEGLLIDGDSFVRLYKGCMVGELLWLRSNGFCNEEHELILVYDCTVIGTLNSHLLEINNDPLLWKKRLPICIDIARGLEYLHTNVDIQFIYRNIKPSNVFLDDKGVAKFCAFELSVPIPSSITTETLQTAVCCMLGYTDPDYFLYGTVTKKSVVYTFGVMLLEILCAKKPYTHVPKTDEDSLLPWFKGCIKRGTIEMVIDPYLIGIIAPECFRHYVNTALSCLVKESIRRPSMNDVLGSLQSSLQLQEAWENSFQMGMAFFPGSYNDTISVDSEFTIGEQSFLISDLVQSWRNISPSVSE
ncbi:hypothetical protein Vadar_014245 [Vaccinium darrowii]|uniref:Uncharacterized protein n=1 Tax=Vaccinium darrowii TaxID=229202 RepID=A0ACB7YVH2_9ERIC|nr:hypothetical protein Vadar_014245 [Vaccinium darrowii]